MKNAVAVAVAAAGGGGGVGVGVVVGVVAVVVVVVVVVLVVVVVSFWRQQQSLNLDRPLNQSLTRPMCMIHHLKYLMLELLESNLKQILSQKVSELHATFVSGRPPDRVLFFVASVYTLLRLACSGTLKKVLHCMLLQLCCGCRPRTMRAIFTCF